MAEPKILLSCPDRFSLQDVHEILGRYCDASGLKEPSIGETFELVNGFCSDRASHARAHAEAMAAVRMAQARNGLSHAAESLLTELGSVAIGGEVARG